MRQVEAVLRLLAHREWNRKSNFRQWLLGERTYIAVALKAPTGTAAAKELEVFSEWLAGWKSIAEQLPHCVVTENRTLRVFGEVAVPLRLEVVSIVDLAALLGQGAIARLRRIMLLLQRFEQVSPEWKIPAIWALTSLETRTEEDINTLLHLLPQLRESVGLGRHLRSIPLADIDPKFIEKNLSMIQALFDRKTGGMVSAAGGLAAWLGCQVPWRARWDVVREMQIPRGGQALACVVTRRTDPSAGKFFLKMFDGAGTERRARMFREVACYRTLSHPGIPELIESNSAEYEDQTAELYLVTELVAGKNLGQYMAENRLLSSADALNVFGQLLDIVEYAHSQGVVHRDIKPENVMIELSTPLKVRLVDFGLSFLGAEREDNDHKTELGQEIGNRFLRLPEHGGGSKNKRDERSDLTQCVGLLFFALTGGLRPRLLEDENRRRPHQRAAAQERLARHVDLSLIDLLNVFDRAFEMKIDARWQTADELRRALSKIHTTACSTND